MYVFPKISHVKNAVTCMTFFTHINMLKPCTQSIYYFPIFAVYYFSILNRGRRLLFA